MNQPVERIIDAGGFRTHYWEMRPQGESRGTVVLVHEGSIGADAWTSWAALFPLLGDDYRVLAPDLLGFGDTDKAIYFDRSPHAFRGAHLAAWCEAVDVEPGSAHFVGHSLGGSLVLRALASATSVLPARSGASISGSGGPWRSARGIEELGRFDGSEGDVRRVVDLMVDGFPGIDDLVRQRYENTRKRGHVEACLAGRVRHPAPPPPAGGDDWPAPLSASPVPLLVVGGDRDDLLEPGWTDHFAELAPKVTTQRVDTKHAPNVDQPKLVADLLRDFFATVERPATAGAR
ncbi:alpha/beta fold hydrolase [Qaidamihabitans albus]|uniref:alpha/beta fold hydrolase n=1 Tax=Qaidamihabitans albus TaxID=2795733 RepID=UPI0018F22D73|nr:alpha/beta hydrolase [Qaidamihabitans albus]